MELDDTLSDDEVNEIRSHAEAAWSISPHTVMRLVRTFEGERDTTTRLRALIGRLADDEDCDFDHHGGCQTHGYLSLEPGEVCPMKLAQDIWNEDAAVGVGAGIPDPETGGGT